MTYGKKDKVDWENWVPTEKAVLVFLWDTEEDNVLLIHKLRGLGQGKINVPGGRLEQAETWAQAAVRETREETHLNISNLEDCAEHKFQFADGYALLVKAFLAYQWEGIPTDTEEAAPFWCLRKDIPYEKMWADDILWVPRIFEGHSVRGEWLFKGDEMLSGSLNWSFR